MLRTGLELPKCRAGVRQGQAATKRNGAESTAGRDTLDSRTRGNGRPLAQTAAQGRVYGHQVTLDQVQRCVKVAFPLPDIVVFLRRTSDEIPGHHTHAHTHTRTHTHTHEHCDAMTHAYTGDCNDTRLHWRACLLARVTRVGHAPTRCCHI